MEKEKKEKSFEVTPYEVKGVLDDAEYERLMKEFGINPINKQLLDRIKKHTKELHFMLNRGVFFAHRDMDWLLNEYEKGNKFFLYTGRAPSGETHIGHLVPWVFTKWLQDKFGCELWFQFPDDEKFMFKQNLSYEEVQKYTYENMLDVIALGFNPKKTHFILDTKHAGLLYPEAIKVAKKITFSTVKAVFGFTNDTNIGSIFYTSMQTVPAFLPSVLAKKNIPCLIPLGVDQDPHFRITRDILPKLGYYKPAIIHSKFLSGLKLYGGKMSTSDSDSTIWTTDTPEQVKKKIMKHAFSGGQSTIEEHRKKGGNPDIDVAYQWLYFFFEPDDKKIKKIHDDYKSGKMLSGELKAYLVEKINAFLKEHQKNRELAKKQIDKFIFKV
ncbi:MAG: tryptophan--tRNA ligase [Candidatus Pacearchaeota archaeon]|nr:tryptophan--tRNA ligase [Candidatus Pacearchaeota archaeon]